jgi:hypothetical protein
MNDDKDLIDQVFENDEEAEEFRKRRLKLMDKVDEALERVAERLEHDDTKKKT